MPLATVLSFALAVLAAGSAVAQPTPNSNENLWLGVTDDWHDLQNWELDGAPATTLPHSGTRRAYFYDDSAAGAGSTFVVPERDLRILSSISRINELTIASGDFTFDLNADAEMRVINLIQSDAAAATAPTLRFTNTSATPRELELRALRVDDVSAYGDKFDLGEVFGPGVIPLFKGSSSTGNRLILDSKRAGLNEIDTAGFALDFRSYLLGGEQNATSALRLTNSSGAAQALSGRTLQVGNTTPYGHSLQLAPGGNLIGENLIPDYSEVFIHSSGGSPFTLDIAGSPELNQLAFGLDWADDFITGERTLGALGSITVTDSSVEAGERRILNLSSLRFGDVSAYETDGDYIVPLDEVFDTDTINIENGISGSIRFFDSPEDNIFFDLGGIPLGTLRGIRFDGPTSTYLGNGVFLNPDTGHTVTVFNSAGDPVDFGITISGVGLGGASGVTFNPDGNGLFLPDRNIVEQVSGVSGSFSIGSEGGSGNTLLKNEDSASLDVISNVNIANASTDAPSENRLLIDGGELTVRKLNVFGHYDASDPGNVIRSGNAVEVRNGGELFFQSGSNTLNFEAGTDFLIETGGRVEFIPDTNSTNFTLAENANFLLTGLGSEFIRPFDSSSIGKIFWRIDGQALIEDGAVMSLGQRSTVGIEETGSLAVENASLEINNHIVTNFHNPLEVESSSQTVTVDGAFDLFAGELTSQSGLIFQGTGELRIETFSFVDSTGIFRVDGLPNVFLDDVSDLFASGGVTVRDGSTLLASGDSFIVSGGTGFLEAGGTLRLEESTLEAGTLVLREGGSLELDDFSIGEINELRFGENGTVRVEGDSELDVGVLAAGDEGTSGLIEPADGGSLTIEALEVGPALPGVAVVADAPAVFGIEDIIFPGDTDEMSRLPFTNATIVWSGGVRYGLSARPERNSAFLEIGAGQHLILNGAGFGDPDSWFWGSTSGFPGTGIYVRPGSVLSGWAADGSRLTARLEGGRFNVGDGMAARRNEMSVALLDESSIVSFTVYDSDNHDQLAEWGNTATGDSANFVVYVPEDAQPGDFAAGDSFELIEATLSPLKFPAETNFDFSQSAPILADMGLMWDTSGFTFEGGQVLRIVALPVPENALEEWRLLWFGTVENTGDAADSATPAGDGVANLLKFATTGSNPWLSATMPGDLEVDADGETLTFTYTRNPDAAGVVTYAVRWSETLEADSWSDVGVVETNVDPGPGDLETVTVSVPYVVTEPRFVRLEVSSEG